MLPLHNRPHPSMLRVTVESFIEMREATRDAAEAVADGDEQPAVVSFATVNDLRTILTDRRIELRQTLVATDGAAESISALAAALDCDYHTVQMTSHCSRTTACCSLSKRGAKRPYLPYERILLDVELAGWHASDEPTAA